MDAVAIIIRDTAKVVIVHGIQVFARHSPGERAATKEAGCAIETQKSVSPGVNRAGPGENPPFSGCCSGLRYRLVQRKNMMGSMAGSCKAQEGTSNER